MPISENIQRIKEEIPKHIKLIAVSKMKPIEDIVEAYNCGIRDFGENKVQELVEKYEILNKDINWHFIGHLQRNKVKYLVGKVHLIHSLDSKQLLTELEKCFSKHNEEINTLIQINIGREPNKYGILEEDLEDLISSVEMANFVKVKGIMVIIPKGDDASNEFYFNKAKKIWDYLKLRNYKNIKMEILSMGMTNDYKVAIKAGSNMIRIGEGIFGKRI